MFFRMQARWAYLSSFFLILTTFLAAGPAVHSQNRETAGSLSDREWAKLLHQAQHGNRRAQTRAGIAFLRGEGVKQDFSEARKWLTRAAEQADPLAEHNLGVMCYAGLGGERSAAAAAKWFEKAAAAGLPEAQFNAARLYETGTGVARNFGRALELYEQAAKQGYARAQNNLGRMYEHGEGIAPAPKAAIAVLSLCL